MYSGTKCAKNGCKDLYSVLVLQSYVSIFCIGSLCHLLCGHFLVFHYVDCLSVCILCFILHLCPISTLLSGYHFDLSFWQNLSVATSAVPALLQHLKFLFGFITTFPSGEVLWGYDFYVHSCINFPQIFLISVSSFSPLIYPLLSPSPGSVAMSVHLPLSTSSQYVCCLMFFVLSLLLSPVAFYFHLCCALIFLSVSFNTSLSPFVRAKSICIIGGSLNNGALFGLMHKSGLHCCITKINCQYIMGISIIFFYIKTCHIVILLASKIQRVLIISMTCVFFVDKVTVCLCEHTL